MHKADACGINKFSFNRNRNSLDMTLALQLMVSVIEDNLMIATRIFNQFLSIGNFM
jgi:hypothetical protein